MALAVVVGGAAVGVGWGAGGFAVLLVGGDADFADDGDGDVVGADDELAPDPLLDVKGEWWDWAGADVGVEVEPQAAAPNAIPSAPAPAITCRPFKNIRSISLLDLKARQYCR